MSYILDALKKSEQERQQEASPNLLSIHAHPQHAKGSRPHKRPHIFWILTSGLLLLSLSLTIFLAWHQGHLGSNTPGRATNAASETAEPQNTSSPSEENLASPAVIVRDKEKIILGEPFVGMITENPMDVEEQDFFESLPLLKDLPYELQREIPELKFAGHTYSKNPSQRMIIINNNILREGDKIESNMYLKEITWEGVIVDLKNNLFRVNTNE